MSAACSGLHREIHVGLDEMACAVSHACRTCSESSDDCDPLPVPCVRVSTIPEAGCGLFAARDYATGEVIGDYRGLVFSTAEAIRVADKSYLMRLGPQCYVDAKYRLRWRTRFMNDARGFRNNVRFVKLPTQRRAVAVTTRPVRRGVCVCVCVCTDS
jgi:hypothetical protein